jgi:hypothetical protein
MKLPMSKKRLSRVEEEISVKSGRSRKGLLLHEENTCTCPTWWQRYHALPGIVPVLSSRSGLQ